jgi:predicted amidophosphoribosyltransferase
MSEDKIECEKCGKLIDLGEAHCTDYGFGPWPKYGYTCKECIERFGERCAKCGEYYYPVEGIEPSMFSYEYDETEEERQAREKYGEKFLCRKCYDEVFPRRPVKDDLQECEE